MSKKLLCEGFSFGALRAVPSDQLNESERAFVARSNGGIMLTGICQAADKLNGNGRMYPKHILVREIEKHMDKVKTVGWAGELDHPERSEIALDRISHKITDIWFDPNGSDVRCKTLVFNNPKLPCSTIAGGLVEEGFILGISSRGLGSVREDYKTGATIVEDDFSLICFDLVLEPSTPQAFQYREDRQAPKPKLTTTLAKEERAELNRFLNKESKSFRRDKLDKLIDDILRS